MTQRKISREIINSRDILRRRLKILFFCWNILSLQNIKQKDNKLFKEKTKQEQNSKQEDFLILFDS